MEDGDLPQRLRDLPDFTVEYLASLTPEKIARQQRWDEFTAWTERSGRYGYAVMRIVLWVLGAYTAYKVARGHWIP
jgi:hypothetical protein